MSDRCPKTTVSNTGSARHPAKPSLARLTAPAAPLTTTVCPRAPPLASATPPALHPLLRPQLKPRSFPFTVSASRFPCLPGNRKLTSGRNPPPSSPQVEAASLSLWPLDSCLSPSAWHPRPLTQLLELAPAALVLCRRLPHPTPPAVAC